jgi:hypothetical protein
MRCRALDGWARDCCGAAADAVAARLVRQCALIHGSTSRHEACRAARASSGAPAGRDRDSTSSRPRGRRGAAADADEDVFAVLHSERCFDTGRSFPHARFPHARFPHARFPHARFPHARSPHARGSSGQGDTVCTPTPHPPSLAIRRRAGGASPLVPSQCLRLTCTAPVRRAGH